MFESICTTLLWKSLFFIDFYHLFSFHVVNSLMYKNRLNEYIPYCVVWWIALKMNIKYDFTLKYNSTLLHPVHKTWFEGDFRSMSYSISNIVVYLLMANFQKKSENKNYRENRPTNTQRTNRSSFARTVQAKCLFYVIITAYRQIKPRLAVWVK